MRRWMIVVAAVMIAAMMAPTPSAADNTESLLPLILKRGKLMVGTRSTAVGFSFRNDKGELVGFDIDLAHALAGQLFHDETKVDFLVLGGGADRVPAIQSGRVDVVISSLSPFPERAQVIDFSQPYCLSDSIFMVKTASVIEKNADLAGKTIASRAGADLERMLNSAVKGAIFQGYPELSDAFLAMRQGRADAFFYERGAALSLARQFPGQFRVIEDPEHPVERSAISIGLRQGDQALLNYLNWALYDMEANNRLQALHQKWFGTDLLEPNWVKQPL